MKSRDKQLVLQAGRLLTLVFLLLLAVNKTAAQDSAYTVPEFPIGAFISTNENTYDKIDSSGINYMVGGFNTYTQNSPIKLMGERATHPDDYLTKYASGYYTRWEAEKDEVALSETGIKHPVDSLLQNYLYGNVEEYLGATCWASDTSVGHPVDNLIWGPNYKQEKKYRWYQFQGDIILYNTDFRLALRYAQQYPDTTPVSRLSVYYRYKWETQQDTGYSSITLNEDILRVSDFPTDTFYTFHLVYQYPENLTKTRLSKSPDFLNMETDTTFIDDIQNTGIEFRIDWFDVGKMYVDYVEVYDQQIWNYYIQNPDTVANQIKTYTNTYKDWNSLAYWFAYEEPHTIDAYAPYRIIDSLIQNYPGIQKREPLATIVYEDWRGKVNGDWHLQKFVELANPHKLMIDWYPFWVGYGSDVGFSWLRKMFEYADIAQPGFWYVAQGFGERLYGANGPSCYWRKPSPEELNASIMLALAHGSKGIMLWKFSSSWSVAPEVNCADKYVYFDAIVKENGDPTPLYYYVKDELVPRLKGTLGNKLLGINYTGNFLQLKYIIPTDDPPPQPVAYDYLTLGIGSPADNMNWHAGFFARPNYSDDKYFFLANLWGGSYKTVTVKVTPPVPCLPR